MSLTKCEHKYSTEGSDRKHGALRMLGKCSCGWSGPVVEQGPHGQAFSAAVWWVNHILKLDIDDIEGVLPGGSGIESWILPVCSCGWAGSLHYAHNDAQYTNCREQADRHRRENHK